MPRVRDKPSTKPRPTESMLAGFSELPGPDSLSASATAPFLGNGDRAGESSDRIL